MNKIDPDLQMTPLQAAVARCKDVPKADRWLHDLSAPEDEDDNYMDCEHYKIINLLLDLETPALDVDLKHSKGKTALFDSVQQDNEILVEKLIKKGANPNVIHTFDISSDDTDYDGHTPVTLAFERYTQKAANKHTKNKARDIIIEILLKYGKLDITLNMKVAIHKEMWIAVESCLEQGADPNTCDQDGNTVLHKVGSLTGDISSSVEAYIEKGVDPDIINHAGETALHKVIKQGKVQAILALVFYNCDVNAFNRSGKSPITYAMEHHPQPLDNVVRMLILAGCDVNQAVNHARDSQRNPKSYLQTCVADTILQASKCTPTLKHVCRLFIRKLMGYPFIEKFNKLKELPTLSDDVKEYLAFEELLDDFLEDSESSESN